LPPKTRLRRRKYRELSEPPLFPSWLATLVAVVVIALFAVLGKMSKKKFTATDALNALVQGYISAGTMIIGIEIIRFCLIGEFSLSYVLFGPVDPLLLSGLLYLVIGFWPLYTVVKRLRKKMSVKATRIHGVKETKRHTLRS
jgi:hypothetical protein